MYPPSMLLSAASAAVLARAASAAYVLADDYKIDSFSDYFNYFNESDPTDGFVKYVPQQVAEEKKYVQQKDGAFYIGPDYQTVSPPEGRESVRIESKKSYNAGSLIILDIAHMPAAECGVWPAFWTYGPEWPKSGEIDIIEGVNDQAGNLLTLHTGGECTIETGGQPGQPGQAKRQAAGAFEGKTKETDCRAFQPGFDGNGGCSIDAAGLDATYGQSLNKAGGAVYATEFSKTGITIWRFLHKDVPNDITKGKPDPSAWPTPLAIFSGSGCNYEEQFKDQSIVFNIDFCGVWAGGEAWDKNPKCSALGACVDHVGQNPELFKEAYWLVNSLRVYEQSSAGDAGAGDSTNSSTPADPNSSPPADSTSSAPADPADPASKPDKTKTESASIVTVTAPPITLTLNPDGSLDGNTFIPAQPSSGTSTDAAEGATKADGSKT